jgi:membrane associated rhomboid family serine protease
MIPVPYAIETLEHGKPTANWVIMGICVVAFLGMWLGIPPIPLIDALVLRGFHPAGLLGHMFLHAGLVHLIGNMLFLWVFGNALCSSMGNVAYPLLYLGGGVCAAGAHLLLKGGPAVGASGAISVVMGVVAAMYPLNRVHLLWIAPRGIARGHNFLEVRAWGFFVFWLLLQVLFWIIGVSGIAYWVHIAGMVAGVAIGLLCLHAGWMETTEHDNRTLLDLLKGPATPQTRGATRHPKGGKGPGRRSIHP